MRVNLSFSEENKYVCVCVCGGGEGEEGGSCMLSMIT
jgi:hypothetical protein